MDRPGAMVPIPARLGLMCSALYVRIIIESCLLIFFCLSCYHSPEGEKKRASEARQHGQGHC
jgi:hypothetical protein